MIHRRHFLSLLPAGLLAGCSEEKQEQKLSFPKVPWRLTATTRFAADFAELIGGKAVQVKSFLAEGVTPGTFVPSAPDIARLRTSDILLIHGLGLERKWTVDFDELGKSGVRVFSATSKIPAERILHPSGPGGPPDPHVWTHPELAILMVNAVEEGLKEMMPQLSEYFTRRAYQVRLRLEGIMRNAVQRAKELKPEDRFLLTSHDTMQYFAAAFSLEARALAAADGTVPEQLPLPMLEWIAKHRVKSLFREPAADADVLRRMLFDVKVDPSNVIHTLTLPAAGSTTVTPYKVYDTGTAAGALQHICEMILATLAAV
jgi:ABC-type Zn uptake system ZnuABC Zn-binding protein ZnuA